MNRVHAICAVVVLAAAPLFLAAPSLAEPTKAAGPKASASASVSGFASASASAGTSATPPAAVSADVLVLHASNSGGGIDPRVEKLKEQLRKPPFSSYDTYKLLSQTRSPLAEGKPSEMVLPNGRTLRVTLKGMPEPNRYKVATVIAMPNGKEQALEVTAPLEETFFMAGQPHEKGVLVVGIKVVR